jgi:hypothetical protein
MIFVQLFWFKTHKCPAFQIGVLTKSSVTMNEQKIVIKNTKQEEPIILTFVEHVPKSTDEKIKVSFLLLCGLNAVLPV